jgi:putative pyruvate formate lyase activating enzyme
MTNCNICPRKCNVDRSVKRGVCGCSDKPKVNIYQLHYGEEPIISGTNGSGTIFFSGCNLSCVFCQNYTISQMRHGKEYSIEELSDMMLEIQMQNAHNINLVTPTHFTLQIREAIILAKNKGLTLPIVWNSNGYEEADTLKEVEGLVDIYMPDFKYYNPEMSFKYSEARDYPEKAKEAILEMYRQVGHIKFKVQSSKFKVDEQKEKMEIAAKGLLIRLLVLPNNLNSIEHIIKWINDNIGNETWISLMGQYYPAYKVSGIGYRVSGIKTTSYKDLSRGITNKEYMFAKEQLEKFGFENGFIQDLGSNSDWTPDFLITN